MATNYIRSLVEIPRFNPEAVSTRLELTPIEEARRNLVDTAVSRLIKATEDLPSDRVEQTIEKKAPAKPTAGISTLVHGGVTASDVAKIKQQIGLDDPLDQIRAEIARIHASQDTQTQKLVVEV